MKTILIGMCIFLLPLSINAQLQDAAHPDWQHEVPKIIYPNADLVNLYETTWAIAADRVRKDPEGLPASPYLDENCYEDQIWIWDSCFMVMFSKYAPNAYPGKQTLDNLYLPIHEKIASPLRIHLRDNPPLFAWIEHDNYVFTGDKEHLKYVLEDKRFLQRYFKFFNEVPVGDEQDGFYYDINKQTGEPCRIKTPASFWAMLAEIPDKRQVERMVEYLKSADFMGGKYPWNSLSRDDKNYNN